VGSSLDQIDPLVSLYQSELNRIGEQEFFQKTVEELLAQHSFQESRPPFAMGQRRQAK
jgi:hypothetical protein